MRGGWKTWAAGGTDRPINLFAVSTDPDALWLSDHSGKITYRSHRGSPHHCLCVLVPLVHPECWGELTNDGLPTLVPIGTSSPVGVPITFPSGHLNQGPKLLGVQGTAQTLSMDRAGGASVLHEFCVPTGVTSVVMLK